MCEMKTFSIRTYFATNANEGSFFQLVCNVWLIEPHGANRSRLIFEECLRNIHPTFPCSDRATVNHFPNNGCRVSVCKSVDGRYFGIVIIAKRQMKKQIAYSQNPNPFEFWDIFFTNAGKVCKKCF